MSKYLSFICLSILLFNISCSKIDNKKERLESKVNKLLKQSSVSIRAGVDNIFSLADIYLSEGNEKDAIRLYEKALEVDGWRLDYQLKLAKLLNKTGSKPEAIEKAKITFQYAEELQLIEDANKFLYELNSLPDKKTNEISDFNYQIVLVPVGKVNSFLLDELRNELQNKMGIKYSISDTVLEPGKFDRNPGDEFLIEFVRKLVHYFKTKEKLPMKGQYNVSRLIAELEKTFNIKNSDIAGYLGITKHDIFEDEANYLFGWGQKGYGIISYYRFSARYNYEPPNRPRLLTRTLKQAISTSFFILGIPRCSTPTCIRAYPNCLSEHDQKSTEICSLCKKRLSLVINKK